MSPRSVDRWWCNVLAENMTINAKCHVRLARRRLRGRERRNERRERNEQSPRFPFTSNVRWLIIDWFFMKTWDRSFTHTHTCPRDSDSLSGWRYFRCYLFFVILWLWHVDVIDFLRSSLVCLLILVASQHSSPPPLRTFPSISLAFSFTVLHQRGQKWSHPCIFNDPWGTFLALRASPEPSWAFVLRARTVCSCRPRWDQDRGAHLKVNCASTIFAVARTPVFILLLPFPHRHSSDVNLVSLHFFFSDERSNFHVCS